MISDRGRLIQERIIIVEAFSRKAGFQNRLWEIRGLVLNLKEKLKQESIAINIGKFI